MITLRESDVIHLGRTVGEWRMVVAALRIAAGHRSTAYQKTLDQMARDLEGHLPRLSSAKGRSND
jgi:hypothetical protein